MDRNKYFFDNRVLLVMMPYVDSKSEAYDWGWYYPNGTYQFYGLFQWDYSISTVKSFVWHMRVIKYINFNLNSDFNDEKLIEVCEYVANLKNKFITFDIGKEKLSLIVDGLLKYDHNIPPKNKQRKIIFKPFSGITKAEKQKIIGSFSGKSSKLTFSDIYELMINTNSKGVKIKMKDLAKQMNCSERTMSRFITKELKDEIKLLNGSI